MKKNMIISLCMAVLLAVSIFTMPTVHIVVSAATEEIIIDGSENGFEINLTEEYIQVPSNYIIKAYSANGGAKWSNVKADTDTFCSVYGQGTFSKLLSKDLTLWISDKSIDKKTKMPESNAQIIKFATINKRPKTPKLYVNYEILADKQQNLDNKWILADKNGNRAADSVEIGYLDWSEPKISDVSFYSDEDIAEGENLQYAEEGYKKTVPYAYRIAPTQQGSTYIAGSKPKKISVKLMPYEPEYKVDTKTKTIKVKAGTSVIIDNKLTVYTKKSEIDVSKCKKGDLIFLWTTAMAKKPPSQTQWLYID